jgi:hypothetical protein
LSQEDFEFVGVHVRMTDYIHHMSAVHPGSVTAQPSFYHKAMDWMTETVEKRLIFVVVSDDTTWAYQNIVQGRLDVYLAGNS